MNEMPIALIVTRQLSQEARSALPGAPVVPHVDKVATLSRTRKAVAGGLRHLADLVAPSRPVRYSSARSALRREAG